MQLFRDYPQWPLYLHTLSIKWNDPAYAFSEHFSQSRLCNNWPNNSGLLCVNDFDKWQCHSVYCKILRILFYGLIFQLPFEELVLRFKILSKTNKTNKFSRPALYRSQRIHIWKGKTGPNARMSKQLFVLAIPTDPMVPYFMGNHSYYVGTNYAVG